MKAILADNIPYTLDAIRGLVEGYNAALWPVQLLALLLIVPLIVGGGRSGRWRLAAAWILAAAWTLCGLVYYLRHLAPLDWSAAYAGWAFCLQGLVLALLPGSRGGGMGAAGPAAGMAGVSLMGLACLGSPLLQWLASVPLGAIALVGITPELTVLFTAGWLARCGIGGWPWLIPCLASVYAFASGWALGYIPGMLPLPLILCTLLVTVVERKTQCKGQ